MPKFLVIQDYRMLIDCQKEILIEAADEKHAQELYEELGDDAGEVIFDDEFDCEIHDYGKMKIEPQEEKNEH